jgi:hypothetical protein
MTCPTSDSANRPITLEDVYLKMVGHESPAEDNGKEANDDTAAA